MGSEPDSAETVEPVEAFDQIPEARCFGRAKAEEARDAMVFLLV